MASRNIYAKTFDEDVQQSDQQTCPECNGRVATNAHETVCETCGLVIEDQQIDPGPEWRSFDDDTEQKRRTGAPNTVARHDRGIGSEIGDNHQANGGRLGSTKRKQLSRLRREHRRGKTRSKAERNLMSGLIEIRRMTSAHDLGESVRKQACKLFRTAQDDGLLPGRSIEGIASACLYAVCRLNEHPRTFEDIARVSKVSEHRVRHAYTVVNRELALPVPPLEPMQYLPKIASDVDASHETERRARALLERAGHRTISNGNHPAGAAGGALYLAGKRTGERVTQQSVADAADVSTITIRNRYRDLETVTA